jgi:hypothetical protein
VAIEPDIDLDKKPGNGKGPDRRKIIGSILSTAAVFGLTPSGMGEATKPKATSTTESTQEGTAGSELDTFTSLAKLRNYKARRSSSYDRTGGNNDSVPIEVGQAATILDVSGAGVVTHLWFTISSDDPLHLKNLVLRAYWDGETDPSVEVPIGDFFGLGLGEYFLYQSALLCVAPMKALNAYFQMPFASSARMTVTNEGAVRTGSLYFAVDYIKLPELPSDVGYFHAQYRQATPCKGWTNDWKNEYQPPVGDKKNLTGEGNYVFMEAHGRGHFIGVTQSVLQNQDQWFGEGDDMIFIDDQKMPVINGTGTEDYYNGAWNFGDTTFSYPHVGAPHIVDPGRIGARYSLYRWHLESPITFENYIRVTIEHGHANHRSDNYFSTAYWYQTEPHTKFPALPDIEARVPRVFRVGGAGAVPLPSSE